MGLGLPVEGIPAEPPTPLLPERRVFMGSKGDGVAHKEKVSLVTLAASVVAWLRGISPMHHFFDYGRSVLIRGYETITIAFRSSSFGYGRQMKGRL
jgi:hypothetical protein